MTLKIYNIEQYTTTLEEWVSKYWWVKNGNIKATYRDSEP
jgi:hypothetical protein